MYGLSWAVLEHLEAHGTSLLLVTGLLTILTTGATYRRPAMETTSGVTSCKPSCM